MSPGGRRADRVRGLMRQHLTELLRDLGDARLSTLVVTEVDVSGDLSVVTVFVRALAAEPDPKGQKLLLKALSAASGRLKRGLAPRLDLRKLPELRFKYDLGHDNVRRVDALLHEIEAEPKPKPEAEPEPEPKPEAEAEPEPEPEPGD